MSETEDNKLETGIKQALDNSVDLLDAETLSRIRQVRARAVAKAETGSFNWFGVMSGAVATACVMVFTVMLLFKSPAVVPSIPVDDIELISSSDSLELFEDLEFYEWLEDHELAG